MITLPYNCETIQDSSLNMSPSTLTEMAAGGGKGRGVGVTIVVGSSFIWGVGSGLIYGADTTCKSFLLEISHEV